MHNRTRLAHAGSESGLSCVRTEICVSRLFVPCELCGVGSGHGLVGIGVVSWLLGTLPFGGVLGEKLELLQSLAAGQGQIGELGKGHTTHT